MTLVILTRTKGNEMEVARKFRVSGAADVARYFPVQDGKPVVGPNVFRELTHAEIKAAGKPASWKRTNYLECLVPVTPAPASGGAATEEQAA